MDCGCAGDAQGAVTAVVSILRREHLADRESARSVSAIRKAQR